MARTTISLPDELKANMDVVDGVNWSAVAADAFARKLRELEMTDIVERLRTARQSDDAFPYTSGRVAGNRWAQHFAAERQLQRLEALDDEWFAQKPPGRRPQEDWLAIWVDDIDTDALSRAEIKKRIASFWTHVPQIDGGWNTEALRGFRDGAVVIYEQVRDLL